MSRVHEYCLDGYLLKVNDFAYLVEIENNLEDNASEMQLEDLPDWIFDSRHAIWLTVENLPMKDRATRGDRIREKLLELSKFSSKEVAS